MKKILFILSVSLFVVSCSKEQPAKANQPAASSAKTDSTKKIKPDASLARAPASQEDFDFNKVVAGGKIFKENCAVCHGENAQGAANWRIRNPDGKLKPPPLNGTGHMWHHSKVLLMSIISNGTIAQGGDMPAWGNKLSQQEIDEVITWLQTKWPKDIYKSWLEINNR